MSSRVRALPPVAGRVAASMAVLAERVGNSTTKGVLLVTVSHDGEVDFGLYGSMRARDLAYVGAMFLRWATEEEG